MTAMNIIGNKEQFGRIQCCEYPIYANMSHPFNASKEYDYDKDIWIAPKTKSNLTMLFFMTGLSEEIWDLMITKQMVSTTGYAVELMMSGYAKIKSKKYGFDVGMHVDCILLTNTSRFVLSENEQNGLLKNAWPPRLYHFQTFPIVDSDCNYSLNSFEFI